MFLALACFVACCIDEELMSMPYGGACGVVCGCKAYALSLVVLSSLGVFWSMVSTQQFFILYEGYLRRIGRPPACKYGKFGWQDRDLEQSFRFPTCSTFVHLSCLVWST